MTGILMMAVGNSYGSAPVNTVAPAVTGTAQVRQTLSCSTGTWTGAPTPTFTYQWQSNSSNISGATSSTYQIVDAYVGTVIRCVVTATNSVAPSGVSANSNATSSVTANVPAAPTIGTATAASSTTASVTFTAPTGPLATGGSAITGYTVYSSGGQTATGASSPITVTGLNSESSYNFYVRANNAVGQSANSGTSNTITTPASYWMAFLQFAWSGAIPMNGQSDSSGASIIIGNGGYGNTPTARLSKEGVVTSSANTSSNNYIYPGGWNIGQYNQSPPRPGRTSTDGNQVYGAGNGYYTGYPPAVTRVDASGNISWYSGLKESSNYSGSWGNINEGTDGYLYLSGYTNGSSYPYMLFAKYSTGGALQWVRQGSSRAQGVGCFTDGTNYYFISNHRQAGSYDGRIYFGKTQSDVSTTIWNYDFNINASQSSYGACAYQAIYAGGYMYVSGSIYEGPTQQGLSYAAILLKIDTSGNIIWQKYYQVDSNSTFGEGIYYGPDGYLYWTGQRPGGSLQRWVVKMDTNANIVWQRAMTYTTSSGQGDMNGRSFAVSVTGSTMYLSITYQSSNYNPLLIKLPADGSKTGTYSAAFMSATYTWQAVSNSYGDLTGYSRTSQGTGGFLSSYNLSTEVTSGNVAGSPGMALQSGGLVTIP